MKKYYVYGQTIEYMEDFSNVLNLWYDMEPTSQGYKAIGIVSEDELRGCDIIVSNNGDLYISDDYKAFGWAIDKDLWGDIYFMILRENESRMERKKYYWLPLDNYNQPNGNIVELEINDFEYNAMKKQGEYIYSSYIQVCERAMD